MAETLSLSQSIMTGLAGRCPRCGKGRLFSGFLNLRPECDACGLDYAFADSGDGPAIFVILIAGFIVVGAALIVEVTYQPPFWMHAVLWGPLILIVTLLPLRIIKGLLIVLQYHHAAAEGRLERRRNELAGRAAPARHRHSGRVRPRRGRGTRCARHLAARTQGVEGEPDRGARASCPPSRPTCRRASAGHSSRPCRMNSAA